MFLALLTLITGLSISAIAIYYSVLGLAAIFAAAPIPIYIMGTILEISKLVTASWLKQNWDRVPITLKLYLTISVVVLMIITSMGIFGFLSKAHSDQSLVSGDVQAKIAIYDEKIKIAKDNIEANRRALKQMDEAVDQLMSRTDSEKGAERSVQIRRQQGPERQRLLKEIETEQKKIAQLNEERAPIAAEVRKVEAEVGPIKYIAKFIYGDDSDTNLLEKAVTWVIVIIVLVFDPLAVLLLLASQMSFQWLREEKEKNKQEQKDEPKKEEPDPPVEEPEPTVEKQEPAPVEEFVVNEKTHPYLYKPWVWKVPGQEPVGHQVYRPEEEMREEYDFSNGVRGSVIKEEPEPVDTSYVESKWPFPAPEENIPGTQEIAEPIELDPIAQEIVDDSTAEDSIDIIEAKKSWKEDHPNDSLKNQRKLLELGLINELPWEREPYLKKKDSDLSTESGQASDQERNLRGMTYFQNSEQSEKSLWNKIIQKKDE